MLDIKPLLVLDFENYLLPVCDSSVKLAYTIKKKKKISNVDVIKSFYFVPYGLCPVIF